MSRRCPTQPAGRFLFRMHPRHSTPTACGGWAQAYLASLPAPARRQDADHRQDAEQFFHVGLIRLILPNARIIHTMRDPVDTCVSCFSQTLYQAMPFSYDLAELGRYYRWYHELMAPLAIGSAGRRHARRLVRGRGRQPGRASPAADRLLRSALGRSLPELSRNQPADRHRQQRPGPPAAVPQLVARWRRYEAYLEPLLAELRELPPGQRRCSRRRIRPVDRIMDPAIRWMPAASEDKNLMTTASPTPGYPAEFDALVALAQREHRAGRLAEAAAAYRKILALRPDVAEAYNNLGNVLMDQGKLDEAAAQYERSGLALKPGLSARRTTTWATSSWAGRASSTRPRPGSSKRWPSAPNLPRPHNNLGTILHEQGKLDQAVARFEQATRSQARLCRSPQQPGQRPAGAGQVRRGGGTLSSKRWPSGPTRRSRITIARI